MTAADKTCLFCKIVAGELPADRLYEDDRVLAFKDIHPQAPFHCLIIPKAHVATLNDFGPEHSDLLGSLLLTAKRIRFIYGPSGAELGQAVGRETTAAVGILDGQLAHSD